MRKVLVVLGLMAGMVFWTPSAALACSCVQADVATQVARAGTVVDATLTWETTNEIDSTYGIAVHRVFKGRAAATEKLTSRSSPSECGVGELATEKRYLFFIDGEHPGALTLNGCGGTSAYDAAAVARIEAVTGSPTGPNATVPGVISSSEPTSGTSVWTIVATAAALAAVLGGLLYLRKRI